MSACLAERPYVLSLEDRLMGWGDAMRMRRQAHETPSKESDYRSPQAPHWRPPGAPVGPSVTLDYADAMVIDGQVAALPMKYNVVLRAHYVGRSKPERMLSLAKQVGFDHPTMADVDAMVAMGRAMLAKRLEAGAVFRNPREHLAKRLLGDE